MDEIQDTEKKHRLHCIATKTSAKSFGVPLINVETHALGEV